MFSAKAIFIKRLRQDIGIASGIVATIVFANTPCMTGEAIPYVIAFALALFFLIVLFLQTYKMTMPGASANTQLQPIPPAISAMVVRVGNNAIAPPYSRDNPH